MAWRLAKSLETLRNQVNAAYPNRSKVSDGTIATLLFRWYNGDMTHCIIDECTSNKISKDMCKPHYDAWYRTGDPKTYRGDRSHLSLWDKIQDIGWTRNINGCLEYNGYRNNNGYGQFRDVKTNKLVRVHRAVYSNLIGELSSKDQVLHLCDNPACSEPTHLQKGDYKENMRQMSVRQRFASAKWTHCPNGHQYTKDRPPGISNNRCKECTRVRNRKYYAKKKGKSYVL